MLAGAALLAASPFVHGFWFEGERLAVAALVLAAAAAALVACRRLALDPVAGLLLLLAALYVAAVAWAASRHQAVVAALATASYAAFYVVLLAGLRDRGRLVILVNGVLVAEVALAVLTAGLASGAVSLPGGVAEGRIGALFQYPNALAAFAMVGLPLGVARLLGAASAASRTLAGVGAASAAFVLPLTGSRGAVVGLAVGLAVAAASWPRGQGRPAAAGLILAGGGGFLAGLWAAAGAVSANWWPWPALVAALGAGGLAARRTDWRLAAPTAGVLILAISFGLVRGDLLRPRSPAAAPASTAGAAEALPAGPGLTTLLFDLRPFERPPSSARLRLVYAADALRLIRERPLWGWGGGAWNAMYRSRQRYGYVSSYVHNQYLETWLEVGAAGPLAWVGLWLLLLRAAWRRRAVGGADPLPAGAAGGAATLLAQAAFDFTLSYPSLRGL